MKVVGTVKSLMGGVSEQTPKDRREGQHGEQVNMIPDPVRGLCRRHGTRFMTHSALVGGQAITKEEVASWLSSDYSSRGVDYTVLRRAKARQVGAPQPLLYVYDQTNNKVLNYTRNVSDLDLDIAEQSGCPTLAGVGKYIFLAGHTPTQVVETPVWDTPANAGDAAIWIKQGDYDKTYTATLTKVGGGQVTLSVSVPKASYPEPLNTSRIPTLKVDPTGAAATSGPVAVFPAKDNTGKWLIKNPFWGFDTTALSIRYVTGTQAFLTNVFPAAPTAAGQISYDQTSNGGQGDQYVWLNSIDSSNPTLTLDCFRRPVVINDSYTRLVAESTETYNAAQTAWIVQAANAAKPSSIAAAMLLQAQAAGLTGSVVDSTLLLIGVTDILVSDGGDNSRIIGVGQTVVDNASLCPVHKVGKVVRVLPKGSDNAYYLKAEARNETVTSGYTEVTWVESFAVAAELSGGIIYATCDSDNVYVASSPALLSALVPSEPPRWGGRICGDTDNSKLPYFAGKKITYMSVFQDRLLIGAGAVLSLSQVGSYLTFFRKSVLTVQQDDAFELLSQGSEDDVFQHSVLYERSLVLFGKRRQYLLDGSRSVTPLSTSLPVMSTHPNASEAPPVATGSLIFYAQSQLLSSAVHQIQPGKSALSSESYPVSSQIDTYLAGAPIELVVTTKPTHLVCRLTGSPQSLYVYTYLDSPSQGRVQDAWHKFSFSTDLGMIVGVSRVPEGLLVFFFRYGATAHLAVDLLETKTGLSLYPYLDSWRPYAVGGSIPQNLIVSNGGDSWATAFNSTSAWRFLGGSYNKTPDLLAEFPLATGPTSGARFVSEFTPTNPFYRDANGKALVNGALTVTALSVGLTDSSGLQVTVKTAYDTDTREYNARILNAAPNVVGLETITDGQESVVVAQETRDYTVTFGARTWLPLTITTVEWSGQLFNRARLI